MYFNERQTREDEREEEKISTFFGGLPDLSSEVAGRRLCMSQWNKYFHASQH